MWRQLGIGVFALVIFLSVQIAHGQNRPANVEDLIAIIRYQNSPCKGISGDEGICLRKAKDCERRRGTNIGTCARGLSNCCLSTLTCGDVTSRNETVFVNRNYPNTENGTDTCQLTIERPDNACQLRLDMQEFFLSEPDENGLCTTYSFMVRTTAGERLPIFCGENKGPHLYVDMGQGSATPVVLSVVSNGDKMSRRWKIKISMIECGSLNMDMFVPFESTPPTSCPANEIYKFCHANCSDCERRGQCPVAKCHAGCDCAPRFFRRSPEEPCLPVEKCPVLECGENEVFRDCGPMCERCRTYRCQAISCDHKCYCKAGYLRNEEGRCVPEEDCPQRVRCGRTEEWSDSGPANEYCLRPDNDTAVEVQNRTQCYCKEGYKRSGLGLCIEESRCGSIKCLPNETFYKCIPKCKTTCRDYNDTRCEENADDDCFPGCFCSPGMVMNDFRRCVEVEDCPEDMMHDLSPKEDTSTTEPPLNASTAEERNSTESSADSTNADVSETTTEAPSSTSPANTEPPATNTEPSTSSTEPSTTSTEPPTSTESSDAQSKATEAEELDYDFDNENL